MPTAEEWRDRLLRELADEAHHVDVLWRYQDGEHRLGFATPAFLEAFGSRFGAFASNWCPIVVNAVAERLHIDGFRVGDADAADEQAHQIWQQNFMDADSQMGHTEALVAGTAHALVWPTPDGPQITVESASSAIVAHNPRNRRERLAGLRLSHDPDRYLISELFVPGRTYTWRSQHPQEEYQADNAFAQQAWLPHSDTPEVESSMDVVPLIELPNQPRLRRHARFGKTIQSELSNVIPVQDAVNKLLADMMVAAEYAAMPQRWATGIENRVDKEGKPLPPIAEYGSRLWTSGDDDTKFGQFQAAELSNYTTAVETLVQHIASQSATPPHYFYLSGQFPSGDAIQSAEAALITKVRDRQRTYGEGWEEVMRVALSTQGVDLPLAGVETIWRNPEVRSEAQMADAAIKRREIGVPNKQLQLDVGYTPAQIAQFGPMLAAQQLLQEALSPIQPEPVTDLEDEDVADDAA